MAINTQVEQKLHMRPHFSGFVVAHNKNGNKAIFVKESPFITVLHITINSAAQ